MLDNAYLQRTSSSLTEVFPAEQRKKKWHSIADHLHSTAPHQTIYHLWLRLLKLSMARDRFSNPKKKKKKEGK
jgi:hypothetical protein